MLDIQLKETAKVSKMQNQCRQGFINCCLDVNPPAPLAPADNVLFPSPDSDIPDAQFLKAHFFNEGKLTEDQLCRIVEAGIELLSTEPNLLHIPAPITSKRRTVLLPIQHSDGTFVL